MKLSFDMKELKPIIAHCQSANAHRKYMEEDQDPAKPALWLVKDHGIYLMSNGLPFLMKNPEKPSEGGKVCYAKNHAPDEEWVGGDDFCDVLDLEGFEDALEHDAKNIVIEVTASKISVEYTPGGTTRA